MFLSNRSLLIPALASALLLGACGGAKEPASKAEVRPSVAASVVTVSPQTVPGFYEATGTVQARTTTALSARIMGHIREIRVDTGDMVKAGQVVAVLDAREIETGVRTAEAARAEARGAMPEVDNAIAAAKAQLDLAEATWKRMKSLHDQKSITEQEMDEVEAKRGMARANHAMALARKQQLEERIRQADQGVARVALQESYANVVAPFAGIVLERKAQPGMLASPGMPILVVEQSGAYRLEAAIEEALLAKIRVGHKAIVRLDAMEKEMETRVSEIVPALDARSRTFTAKLDLPATPNVRSGLFGRARFPAGEKQSLLVPASSVEQQGQVQRVYVVSEGVARARMITTGSLIDGSLEILSGLTAGERIVAPIPAGLADGVRVEVRP